MAFLHGVETAEVLVGSRVIQIVRSAVIALVGIAPKGATNTLKLVTSEADISQFGAQLPGFSIPQALSAIFSKGGFTKGGAVLVVNVFDPAVHIAAVAAEVLAAVAGRKTKTAFSPIPGQAFSLTSNDGATVYVLGTDYTMDDFGNITILASTIAEGALPKATYKKLDASGIVSATIVGTVDGATQARTGTKCFELAYTMFGITPKILIAPGFSTVVATAQAIALLSSKYRAIDLIDAPIGTSYSVAIAGRGPAGAINFYTSSKRSYLLFPMLKVADPNPANTVNGVVPDLVDYYSSHLAGIIAANDNDADNGGYWVSPSNKQIDGITGVERLITSAINDPSTEANQLNAAGITTYFNAFGSGRRTWGNRSAGFPSSTDFDTFVSVRRTADIVEESTELAQLKYIDGPINKGSIDAVREDVNSLIRTLIGRGALIDGECTYDPADNPDQELAAGHVTWTYSLCPPPPMERMSFKAKLDTTLLKKLNASSAA
jgi:phage tail sheath protein FI